MTILKYADEAGALTASFSHGDLLDFFPVLVDVEEAAYPALRDHGRAIGKAFEGVDIDTLSLVAVFAGGLVFPNDFLREGNLLGLGPGVVKEDIPILEKVDIMMAGMPALGAGSVVLPEDGSVHLADRDKVLAVGDSEEDQAVVLCICRSKEKKREGEGSEADKVCHGEDHRKGTLEGQTLVYCFDQGMMRLSQ